MIKIPAGFLLSGIKCGLKKSNKNDLGLIYCESFAEALGFFTINKNVSYSVTLSRKNISNPIKAVIVNSGNANCFSHKNGLKDTEVITSKLAGYLSASQNEIAGSSERAKRVERIDKKNILIASTGIIGKKLPKEKIISAFPKLYEEMGKENAESFSQSILTTDTFKKISCSEIKLKNNTARILGFAKGAGMIAPNVATMLVFILTDAVLPKALFKKIAKEAIDESFNSVTVDGCMSTNDTVFVLSSKKNVLKSTKEIKVFSKELKKVCLELATMLVKDGEGASKFIKISIKGAKSKEEAKKAGLSIANSNLFKCAVYGANPNWGRIIAALGHAGIAVCEGIPIKMSDLTKKNITIEVDLKRGVFAQTVYTSDLTPEYIKINAEYS
ncbi:MAG: bifunctional glutamate N-acetyltransferase/amino-acid acetyltransferase ArgJ [Candidatus Omnitrophica bacterium]|jgi:glutamate N-acetyltransferase/amino-acid N-acetyltransferase|nr:bifunctional glutamate N-acetyltransferase/amino-acid acetyltransferase ArgJ [Candidatus Omnitrophota bacterium]